MQKTRLITRAEMRERSKGMRGKGRKRDHLNPLYCDSTAINLLIG